MNLRALSHAAWSASISRLLRTQTNWSTWKGGWFDCKWTPLRTSYWTKCRKWCKQQPSKVGRSRLTESENVGKHVGKWQMWSEHDCLFDFNIFFFFVVFSVVVLGSTAPNEQTAWQHDIILMGAKKAIHTDSLHHLGATAPSCPFPTSKKIPVTPASWWETIFTSSVLSSQFMSTANRALPANQAHPICA